MNGGKEFSGSDKGGGTVVMQIPVGWERRLDQERVAYISPSGTVLSSVEQVRMYLLTEGACKCGLECPLILHKVFSFDPAATVKHRTTEDVKADEDVTKLCNHKRKIIAMATLHKSMESPHPSLTLSGPTTGGNSSQFSAAPLSGRMMMMMGRVPQAVTPEYKSAFLSKLVGTPGASASNFQPEQHPSQPQDPRPPCSRHRADVASQIAAAPALSPRVEAAGRPEPFARNYSAFNPGSVHLHRNPLPSTGLAQKPQAAASCLLVGHHPAPPPPPPPRSPKSPLVKISCGFSASPEAGAPLFQKRSPGPCCSRDHQLCPEVDPLGILSPISVSPESPGSVPLGGPRAQPSAQPQVAATNVNASAAVLPLCSSLPLPSGRMSQGSYVTRTRSLGAAPPGERSPQSSRPSSASSDQGGYASCGSARPRSRSPRSLGSPLPPELPGHQSQPAENVPQQKNQPGLLGMPLSQIFGQHNAAFFPASSLLSAAAKAQLASQSKMAAGAHGDVDTPSTLPNGFPLPATATITSSSSSSASFGGTPVPTGGGLAGLQKEAPRRRKASTPTVLTMLKQAHGSRFEANPTSSKGPSQPMSQLLHSLSSQSSQANGSSSAPSLLPCLNHQLSIVASNLTHPSTQSLPVTNVPGGTVGEGAPCQNISTNLISRYQDTSSPLLGLVGQLGQAPGSAPLLKIPASALLMVPNSTGIQNVVDFESTNAPSASISIAGKGQPAITKTTSVLDPGVIVTTTVNGSLPGHLPLGEGFPFMNQDQVLPFGQSASASPLNPSVLGSLPISLPVNQQQTLNQNPLNLVPTTVEGQGDVILNLLGLLNPTLNPALSPNSNDLDGQTLQALQILMAALLQNHSQTAMLPLASINLPLPDLTQQQSSNSPSSVIQLPTFQDHLPSAQPTGDRPDGLPTSPFGGLPANDGPSQPLLFPATSSSPAWLGLNHQLLATVLGSSSDGVTSQPQVCISAVPLGPGSRTPTTTAPHLEGNTVMSVGDPLLSLPGPGKLNTLMPQLLNPLLGASLLGDIAAFNQQQLPSIQAMVNSNSLLLQPLVQALQAPLGIQMLPSQTPLTGQMNHTNPLTCLFQNVQVNVGQALMLPGKAGSLQPVPDSAYPSPLPFQDPSTSQRKSEGTDPSIDALYSGAAEAGSKAEQVVMNSAAPSSYPDPAPAFSTTSAFTATSPQPGRRKIEGTAGRRTSRSISRPGAQEEEEEEEEEEGGCCRRVPRANGEISGHNGCVEELRDPGLCNGRAQCVNGLGGPDTAQWGSLGHHGHRPLGCESSEDGQADGFLSRSSKHAGQSNSQHASQEQRGQEKVNPETVKTLPGGLEGPQRTRKRSKNTPKMSSNLEVALQEAMMELDQITANADQQSPKDKLRKPMKNKRRKIVR